MFSYNETTRNVWFRTCTDWTEVNNFKLVGLVRVEPVEAVQHGRCSILTMALLVAQVMGLAIYNGVLLDVHFPRALYRKMLGMHMTLEDLKEVDPEMGDSMQALLDYDGDDAEVCLVSALWK